MKTNHHRSVKRRALAAGLLVSLALISGALAVPAMAEGGGTPIGDQGVANTPERRADMARQDLANNGPGGRYQSDRGNRGDRRYGNQNYRGDRNYRNYRDQRYSGRSYQPYARSYSYVDPYYYDPRPSPGISLFFGF